MNAFCASGWLAVVPNEAGMVEISLKSGGADECYLKELFGAAGPSGSVDG